MAYRSQQELIQEIVRLREQQNLSQGDLAEVLGLNQSAVSRIESGRRGLAVSELADIAERLNVPVEALLRTDETRLALRATEQSPEIAQGIETAETLADNFLYFKALVG